MGERLSFLCKEMPACINVKVLDDDFNLADLKLGSRTLTQLKDKLHASIGKIQRISDCIYMPGD